MQLVRVVGTMNCSSIGRYRHVCCVYVRVDICYVMFCVSVYVMSWNGCWASDSVWASRRLQYVVQCVCFCGSMSVTHVHTYTRAG